MAASTFEGNLEKILCEEVLLSDEDRKSYTKDAELLRNYIIDKMKENSIDFKNYYKGLSLTGSYLDQLKINLPDEFDMHIKLELPFRINPEAAGGQNPGFVFLKASQTHRFVENGFVNRIELQKWMHKQFENVIKNGIKLICGERTYEVNLWRRNQNGNAVAHTVSAIDVHNKEHEICFDFAPVFEFDCTKFPVATKGNSGSWFAVPQPLQPRDKLMYAHTFMVCAPHWERDDLKGKYNLKNSLRLMKALKKELNMWRLTSYMLKSVYLMELDERDDLFWQKSTGEILICMLGRLLKCLQQGSIPFYFDERLNHLDRLEKNEILSYKSQLSELLQKLKGYQLQGNNASYKEMAKLFGVKV